MSDREARAMESLSRKFPDRRERIAAVAMAALLTREKLDGSCQVTAQKAVLYANALIAELNKFAAVEP